MTLRYLVDTDWVIHYLNGNPNIVGKLLELRDHGLALPVVSLAELYEGVYFSVAPERNEHALHNFLRGVTVLGAAASVPAVGSSETLTFSSGRPACDMA